MKIEKISDDQIKIILDHDDLVERNLKINELSYNGSEKIRNFFKDMMEQAMIECDFHAESDTPLIIEAIPVSHESIMLIVTKANSNETAASQFDFIPKAKDERKFRQKPLIEPVRPQPAETDSLIFCFKTFDELASACLRINEDFNGSSSVHKLSDKYYLILSAEKNTAKRSELKSHETGIPEKKTYDRMNIILSEYAQKINPSPISVSYISEHGELIIAKDAVGIASMYL